MTPARSPAAASIDQTAARWVMRRDAGLTPAEDAELRHWLAAEPRHAEAFARKLAAWSTLDRPHRHGQASEILARLAARASHRQRRRQLIIGAAAAVLFGAASWTYLSFDRASDASVGRGVVLRPDIQRLPDGSVVDLRPGARVEVDYAGNFRRVHLLAGTAYFAVARDPSRPFVVCAGGVEFRALGTRFAVDLSAARVDLLVTEGRVAVETASSLIATAPSAHPLASAGSSTPPAPGAIATLATVDSGHCLAVSPATLAATPTLEPEPVSAPEIDARLAWRAPRLEFSELPLAAAIDLLNRHNPVPLRLADPSLAGLRVSGIIRADNPDGFLRLIASSFDLEGQPKAGAIAIRRRRP